MIFPRSYMNAYEVVDEAVEVRLLGKGLSLVASQYAVSSECRASLWLID